MMAHYNRQTRREGLCIRACRSRSRGHKRMTSRDGIWLTAYGHGLARHAETIEFELPAELVDLLSPACIPAPTY